MAAITRQHRSRFLNLRALAVLKNHRFATKHRIDGPYSGRHPSRQRGSAGEFVDFHPYVEGEDLRRLDWKVLARTQRAYVRRYQDETNLACLLVIDASGSMRFGSPSQENPAGSKLEYVQYLATALSHVIASQQDQVGLAVVSQGLQEFIPPGGTQHGVARVQEAIENLATEPATDMAGALRDLFQQLNRRGVLIVMSDFLLDDLEEAFAAIRLFRHRYWEVVVLHVIHPEEERLPDGTAYRFEGLENEGCLDCSPDDIRALYQKRFEAHATVVRSLSLASGGDYCRILTSVGYLQTLRSFLVERSG